MYISGNKQKVEELLNSGVGANVKLYHWIPLIEASRKGRIIIHKTVTLTC